jgi:hypothetical protein
VALEVAPQVQQAGEAALHGNLRCRKPGRDQQLLCPLPPQPPDLAGNRAIEVLLEQPRQGACRDIAGMADLYTDATTTYTGAQRHAGLPVTLAAGVETLRFDLSEPKRAKSSHTDPSF